VVDDERMPSPARSHDLKISRVMLAALLAAAPKPATAQDASALVRAYPGVLSGIEGNSLVWKDGTRMPIDDGLGRKTFARWLAAPDLEDMFRFSYPAGRTGLVPPAEFDPGRARSAPLFDKMYGDCRKGGVAKDLVPVTWLPTKNGAKLMITRINGAAQQLQKVSDELDQLPGEFLTYLAPSAGTFNCRPIAGTNRLSAHGYGIAIDIATKHAHYWQWAKPKPSGVYPYRNDIPWEIVTVFENHGFIWGGKWHHYDTMHFEYRPELLPPRKDAEGR
jgi:hypothetical protein